MTPTKPQFPKGIAVFVLFTFLFNLKAHNLNCYPRSEPKRIRKYLTLVYIRKVGVAIIEAFEQLLLLFRQRCLQVVVMVGNAPHYLLGFFCFFSAICVWANVSVPHFFKHSFHCNSPLFIIYIKRFYHILR